MCVCVCVCVMQRESSCPTTWLLLSGNELQSELRKGGYIKDYMGDYCRGYLGDTRSLDYSSNDPGPPTPNPILFCIFPIQGLGFVILDPYRADCGEDRDVTIMI